MAKIRGVKPEYWTDEDVCELSIPARLLFIGMWNYACDNGHLQDKPKQIKRRVLPDDDVNVSELIRQIDAAGLIERVDGWITIPNLAKHQKVDRRYFTGCDKPGCEVPEQTVSQRAARRANTVHTPSARRANTVRTECALGDGDGDGDGDGERTSYAAQLDEAPEPEPAQPEPAAQKRRRGTRIPEDFEATPDMVTWAREHAPHANGRTETAKFINYWTAKAGKDATKLDWERTWRNWMLNAEERSPQGREATQAAAPRSDGWSPPDPPDEVLNDPDPSAYPRWIRGQIEAHERRTA